jgi:predicted phosphodiesterase
MAVDAITPLVKELVRQHPDAPARTLARRLVKESNKAITLEQARSRIRIQLGQMGQKMQKVARFKRAARKPGQRVEMPKSVAEPWTPYELGVVGTIGILSDIHVPYHSELALTKAVEHLKAIGVDCLVLNGDTCDFYSISRWMKDPKKRDFKAEGEACRQLLAWLRSQFPGVRIIFKTGNHEERYQHWLWQHAVEISDDPRMQLDRWLDFDDHGIELVDNQRPILCGELPVLHGHEKGKGISSPVNQARGAFLRLHHTVLEGHGHRTSGHAESDMWHKEVFCWSTGCLCDLTPEYARMNKWNWGFAVVSVDKSGSFDVDNLRISKHGDVRSS